MRIVRNPHFWLIVVLFGVCSTLHYVEQINIAGTVPPSSHFGLTRHALDRILFLVPIFYSSYVFGLVGGLTACFAALSIALPRAILISPVPMEATLETAGIFVIGVLVCLLLWTRNKERAKAQVALMQLQAAHQTLQRYVRATKDNEKRLTMLNAISLALYNSLELEETVRKATHLVSELMEVEVTLIFYVSEETQELRLVGYEGVSDEFARTVDRAKIGEGIYGEVAKMGQPMVIGDVFSDPRLFTPEFRKMQIRIQLIVPLVFKERVNGVVCVAMRRPRKFTPEDIDLLTTVGTQIAAAVENAHLYEKERLAAQRLAVSEGNYQRLFESASDAIWVHDLGGNIITANKAAAGLTGYSVEELIGMNVRNFLSDESLALAGQVRRQLFQKEPSEQPYEQHLVKKDGAEAILMLTTSLLIENERPSVFQHVARDVTNEKRMQDNLRQYVQQITRTQEEERKRIARDLHDDTAQALYALARQVDNTIRSTGNLSADSVAFLKDLGEQIRKTLQGVRRFSQDLRPSMLDDLGLLATLRWLVGDMKERRGVEINLRVVGAERRLVPHIELAIFRIVQEALRNIEKHAEASKVEVEIELGKDKVKVSIRDNGKGFKLSGDLGDLPRGGRLGLVGMEERARLLDGTIRVQSELGEGTTVMLEVPV